MWPPERRTCWIIVLSPTFRILKAILIMRKWCNRATQHATEIVCILVLLTCSLLSPLFLFEYFKQYQKKYFQCFNIDLNVNVPSESSEPHNRLKTKIHPNQIHTAQEMFWSPVKVIGVIHILDIIYSISNQMCPTMCVIACTHKIMWRLGLTKD